MPWSGSAGSQTFSRTDGTRTGATTWTQAAAAPVNILATDHDTHDQDVADGINACFKKDGGNTATADLPMGGFKLSNVGVAAARNQYARFSQVQDNAAQYIATVGGTADVITLTPAIAITAYAAGQRFTFIAGGTNTGATTVNVSAVGAKDIKRPDGANTALSGNDIISGTIVDIEYDGTRFLLLNWQSGGALSALQINGGTEETTPAVGDFAPIYDLSATANRKFSLANLMKILGLLTAETSPAADDLVGLYDTSATAARSMTLANMLKVITALTAETAPAVDDELALYDLSATTTDKITLANLFKVINGLTEDTSPDLANDFIASYDASAAAAKKIKLSALSTRPSRSYTSLATNADITAVITYDDTIPQNTEGTQVLSAAITPASTSNRVRVTVTGFGTATDNGTAPATAPMVAALFRDAVADALHAVAAAGATISLPGNLSFVFEHAPSTVSPITYNLRVGPAVSGIMRLNGTTTARRFGGVAAITMVLEEIAP